MTSAERVATVVVDPGGAADTCVEVIEGIGRLSARVARFDVGDTASWALVAESDAVYVSGARSDDVERLRNLVGVPVLDWRDTTATVLVAQVLTTLTRLGRPPRFTRVVIAGADGMPVLGPLLAAAGIRDVTMWNRDDATSFPLRAVAAHAHIVIDVFGLWPWGGPVDLDPVVITADRERDALVVLPGLLRAMAGTAGARAGVDVLHTCVLALIMATGPDHHLPRIPAADLADRIAEAATAALRAGLPSRRSTP